MYAKNERRPRTESFTQMDAEIKTEISIPTSDADALLACADGASALVYLHLRRTGGLSCSKAARDLRMSERDVTLAAEKLRKLGLISRASAAPEDREMPQYTAKDVSSRPEFSALVEDTQSALGRMLGDNDLRILFGIYDHLGLPPEVVLLLIYHCIDTYREKNGAGRVPTMRYIEKEAWFWADSEIITIDAAEEHIRRETERKRLSSRVQEVLQIRGRSLTAGERKYVDSWLEMGFPPETLAVAYDRTVVNTGRLTWRYMDKIVRSWQERGLFTPEAVETGDARPTRKRAAPPQKTREAPAIDGAKQLERMKKLYESLNGGG